MISCSCESAHARRRIVLTGGPGAGKTAVLELVRQNFCKHVRVLPEAASILFSGGFPRRSERDAQRAGQRAIFRVQRELEVVGDLGGPAIVLCDRGTPDGIAYWPGEEADLWRDVGSTRSAELSRYDAVIHLRTPRLGYNHQNPVRIETVEEAVAVDERILAIWKDHPRRYVIASEEDFLKKARRALAVLREELPECCRHKVPEVDGRPP